MLGKREDGDPVQLNEAKPTIRSPHLLSLSMRLFREGYQGRTLILACPQRGSRVRTPRGACHYVDGQPDWKERKNISNDRRADKEFVHEHTLLRLIALLLKET